MHLATIIPSKNGLHHLKECLPTVITAAAQSKYPVQLVVVDDNSTDGTIKQATELFPTVTFVANSSQGVCSARNYGVSLVQPDWLCFLDNDVFVNPDFFNTALSYLKQDIFCITCAGYAAYPKTPDKPEQLDGVKLISWKRGFPRFTSNYFPVVSPSSPHLFPSWGVQGACFFCQYKYFKELQGFDELFEPYLLEETDLAYRGLKRGWKIVYSPNIRYRHKCGGTIASKTSSTTQQLSKRNRIIFVWKNIHDKQLLFSSLLWSLLRGEFRMLWYAWKIRKSILHKRTSECAQAVRTDRDILNTCKEYINE